MDIIQFDIAGKFAHFRKYYANNTALSFSIPPRTTLMGVLAGMLGLPKDSYYESLASDKIHIGIQVKSHLKKSFHRLNLLSIKKLGDIRKSFDSDFRGQNGRIQTPFEIITGLNLRQDEVVYRVYVAQASEDGASIMEALRACLANNGQHFSTSLGIAQFLASIRNYEVLRDAQICQAQDELVDFDSSVLAESVSALNIAKDNIHYFVEEELLPADFKANHNRELSRMSRILFTTIDAPLKVVFSGTYYRCIDNSQQQKNIQFL